MNKVLLCPTSIDDELLYNLVARVHKLTAATEFRETAVACFGVRLPRTATPLPGGIRAFYSRVGHLVFESEAEIFDEHTIFPLVRMFGSKEKSQAVLAKMLHEQSGALEAAGISQQLKTGIYLKMCVQCCAEDVKDHGTAIWRTSHQYPGITACWRHGTDLVDRCHVCLAPFCSHANWAVPPSLCRCGAIVQAGAVSPKGAVELARFTRGLAKLKPGPFPAAVRRRAYRARLTELGLRKGRRRDVTKIADAITAYFGEEWLMHLKASTLRDVDPLRIAHLAIQRASSEASIRATELLLANWLFETPEHFVGDLLLASKKEPTLIERLLDAPKLSPESRLGGESIRDLTKRFGLTRGYEQFVAHRVGTKEEKLFLDPDPYIDVALDALRKGAHLLELQRPGWSHTQLRRLLRVYPEVRAQALQASLKRRIVESRSAVTAWLKEGAAYSRNDFYQSPCRGQYRFLFMHDRDWLERNVPSRVPSNPAPTVFVSKRNRDWQVIDQETIAMLKIVCAKHTQEPLAPRLSATYLSRHIGKQSGWLTSNMKHLPQTRNFVEKVRESKVAATQRRFKNGLQLRLAQGLPESRSKTLSFARTGSSNMTAYFMTRYAE